MIALLLLLLMAGPAAAAPMVAPCTTQPAPNTGSTQGAPECDPINATNPMPVTTQPQTQPVIVTMSPTPQIGPCPANPISKKVPPLC